MNGNNQKLTVEQMKKTNNMDLEPRLIPILAPTYGVIVYQEQVMQIVQSLAGYSLGRADLMRRAMSKKKQHVIEEERQKFVYGDPENNIPGCVGNGISEEIANYIYDQMVEFAKYAFNKAHATAYSETAVWNMHLLVYHPAELFASLMNWAKDIDELQKFINAAKANGLTILPPSIIDSREQNWGKDRAIRFGLSSIKGVGQAASTAKASAPYRNIADFILRGVENTGAYTALVNAGALDNAFLESNYSRTTYLNAPEIKRIFDLKKKIKDKEKIISFGPLVKEILKNESFKSLKELRERLQKDKITYGISGEKVPTVEQTEKRIQNAKVALQELYMDVNEAQQDIVNIPDDEKTKLMNEHEVLGVFVSGNLLDIYEIPAEITPIEAASEVGYQTIAGIILDIDGKGNFVVQDKTGSIRCHIFKKDEAKYNFKAYDGAIVEGKVVIDDWRSTEEETFYQMYPSKIVLMQEKQTYLMTLNTSDFSVAALMLAPFKSKDGIDVYVKSTVQNITRHYLYKVKPEAISELSLKKIKEAA